MPTFPTYDRRTQFLHWASAAAILVVWALAQSWGFFPRDFRPALRLAHVAIGLLLIGLTVARIAWHFTGARRLPPADAGLIGLAAKAGKLAIYLLIPVVLVFGLGFEAIRADDLLGLGKLPSIAPGDRALRRFFSQGHDWTADALIILAGLHALAALWHRFVRRDDVLARMLGRAEG